MGRGRGRSRAKAFSSGPSTGSPATGISRGIRTLGDFGIFVTGARLSLGKLPALKTEFDSRFNEVCGVLFQRHGLTFEAALKEPFNTKLDSDVRTAARNLASWFNDKRKPQGGRQ